ncbi:MAG: hypothetical protein RLZZ393_1344 [Pseudomonadota bacterium]|jgi:tRNA(Ile)-lysidine synthase
MPRPREQQFGPGWLAARIASLAQHPVGGWCVAWSGGADSTALLAALVELRDAAVARGTSPVPLRAIHVDHGLQPASVHFRSQCRRLARSWRVPLSIRSVVVDVFPGRSIEEAARDARYAALRQALRPGECLLSAQHAGDQLETFLLQALRGAGVAGLASMPESVAFGEGRLLRPLLTLSRDALLAYLRARGVDWTEDPTNADLRFDRNYLRRVVLPPLLARWPSAALTIARSARHAAVADAALGVGAARDAAAAADGAGLDITVLRRLSVPRQALALRAWIARRGLPLPDERRLAEVLRMLEVRGDAQPCVRWPGVEVRRHQGRLVVSRAVPQPVGAGMASRLAWRWRKAPRLPLPGGGSLELQPDPWGDVDLARLPAQLQVAGRAALGEATLACDLKSLLRESAIPSWERDAVPLVFAASRVLAVADLWRDEGVGAAPDSVRRGRFVWRQG